MMVPAHNSNYSRGLGQEDGKFEARLGDLVRLCFKKAGSGELEVVESLPSMQEALILIPVWPKK